MVAQCAASESVLNVDGLGIGGEAHVEACRVLRQVPYTAWHLALSAGGKTLIGRAYLRGPALAEQDAALISVMPDLAVDN